MTDILETTQPSETKPLAWQILAKTIEKTWGVEEFNAKADHWTSCTSVSPMVPWLAEFIYYNFHELRFYGEDYDVWNLDAPRIRDYNIYPALLAHIALHEPDISTVNPNQIALWPDQNARLQGPAKRIRTKPHRAVRRMFPWLTEAQVEQVGDQLRDRYLIDPSQYTLKTGENPEDFKHAYAHEQAVYANPGCTRSRKSLANSCMRYSFDHLPHHPAEAYASGDFLMVWVEDSAGYIAARCVVRKPIEGRSYHASGPVYGVNETVINMVENYVSETLGGKVDAFTGGEWEGAKLKAIPYRGGWIAPYLDCHPQCLDSEDTAGFLVISSNGNVDASTYSGVLEEENRTICHACGTDIDPEDASSYDGEDYCESCFHDLFVYCDYYDVYEPRDGSQIVFTRSTYNGRFVEETWGPSAVDRFAVYCEDADEYWRKDLVSEDYEGNYITPEQIDDGDYILCSISGYYYPDHMIVILNGEPVGEDQIDSDLHDFNDSTGEWETRDAA